MKTIHASILAIRPGEIELEFPYGGELGSDHGERLTNTDLC